MPRILFHGVFIPAPLLNLTAQVGLIQHSTEAKAALLCGDFELLEKAQHHATWPVAILGVQPHMAGYILEQEWFFFGELHDLVKLNLPCLTPEQTSDDSSGPDAMDQAGLPVYIPGGEGRL